MVENRRRSLEIALRVKNLSAQAFTQVQRSLARIRDAGRDAMDGLTRGARSAKGQLLGIVAAVGGVQKLVIEPAKFEEALTRITLAGAGFAEKIQDIQRVIEDLATSTGTSRDDLASGFENAAKRVETFAEAVDLVTSANKLAAVSGGNVSEAVTGLSAVMQTFGGQIENVDQLSAKLFATTRKLPESANSILTQIGKIAPQAKAAGVGIDDLFAAIATGEQQGVKAGDTLTALRAILDSLFSPVGAAAEALDRMGVNTTDLVEKGATLGEVFAKVQRRADLYGVSLRELGISGRSTSAFLAIAANDGRAFADTLEGISTTSVSEFEAAFDRINSVTKSSIDAFGELSKVAASAFSKGFLTDLGGGLQSVNDDVDAIRIRAELVGLQFRVWVERIRPGVAAVQAFFEYLDLGFSTYRSGVEIVAQSYEAVFLALKASALKAGLEIAEFYNRLAAGVADTLADLSPTLFGDEASEQLAELEAKIASLYKVRAGFISRYKAANELDFDGSKFAESAREVGEAIARLQIERKAIEDKITRDGAESVGKFRLDVSVDTSTLQSQLDAALRELSEVDTGGLEATIAARSQVQIAQVDDVREAFSKIGESALDADAKIRELELQILQVSNALTKVEAPEFIGPERASPFPFVPEGLSPLQGIDFRGPLSERAGLDSPAPSDASTSISGIQDIEASAIAATQEVTNLNRAIALAFADPSKDLPDPETEKIRERIARVKKAREDLEGDLARIQQATEAAFGNAFADFVTGASTAKEAMRDFANDVIQQFARIAAQRLAAQIFSSFAAADGGAIPSTPTAAAADGGVLPVVPFADGGRMRGAQAEGAASTRYRARTADVRGAGGGAPGSVLGLLAEAGMPEAVVPMEGRSIPLALDAKGVPVVTIPGGESIPVRITGKGVTEEEARAALVRSIESSGGAKSANLGSGRGGILRGPTLGVIPKGGPQLAAIPLPKGEAIPLEVDADGNARVSLPKGRSLPAAAQGAARTAPDKLPAVPVQAYADGGQITAESQQGSPLALLAEAGMPEAVVPLSIGGSVPLAMRNGVPVVELPGGRTIPVEVTGAAIDKAEAVAALERRITSGGYAVEIPAGARPATPVAAGAAPRGLVVEVGAGGETRIAPNSQVPAEIRNALPAAASATPAAVQPQPLEVPRPEAPAVPAASSPPAAAAVPPLEVPRPEAPAVQPLEQSRSKAEAKDPTPRIPAPERPQLSPEVIPDPETINKGRAPEAFRGSESVIARLPTVSPRPELPAELRPEAREDYRAKSESLATVSRIAVRAYADGGMVSASSRATSHLPPEIQREMDRGGSSAKSLGLFAEAGMPEAVVPLDRSGSVPISIEGGNPVVTLPGGRSIPVEITGKGISDDKAREAILAQIQESGGRTVSLGAGAGEILRGPTLGVISPSGPAMAAIPLPRGEKIPIEVDAEGIARVVLPKGRTLPAAVGAGGGTRPAALPPVEAFAEGGILGGIQRIRTFAGGGLFGGSAGGGGAVVGVPRQRGTSTPKFMGGAAVGGPSETNNWHLKISALDGPSVERLLTTPEGRRAMQTAMRDARATRRDF